VRHELQVQLIERLLRVIERGVPEPIAKESTIRSENYRSPARLEEEIAVLFRKYPLIVGRSSEVQTVGQYLTHDVCGLPILVLRDKESKLRAYVNSCRHRGTRLLTEPCGTTKGIVCRYHAWTYDLGGALIHVPQEACFPTLDKSALGLVELPVEERHGFVWVVPTPGEKLDVQTWLGPFDDDFAGFGLESHHLHQRKEVKRSANWKLLIDAFLEGYHVKSLHRDSIYRFFRDDAVIFDPASPHIRSAGARRSVVEAPAQPKESWKIRDHATVFYHLFPCTVFVFHPDWLSHVTVYPDGTSSLAYRHDMLIPAAPETADEEAHWQKTLDLIEAHVFQQEDLAICESIQSAIGGAPERFVLGHLEYPMKLFHSEIDRVLERFSNTITATARE
jgi:glycine betaine catabolism A